MAELLLLYYWNSVHVWRMCLCPFTIGKLRVRDTKSCPWLLIFRFYCLSSPVLFLLHPCGDTTPLPAQLLLKIRPLTPVPPLHMLNPGLQNCPCSVFQCLWLRAITSHQSSEPGSSTSRFFFFPSGGGFIIRVLLPFFFFCTSNLKCAVTDILFIF